MTTTEWDTQGKERHRSEQLGDEYDRASKRRRLDFFLPLPSSTRYINTPPPKADPGMNTEGQTEPVKMSPPSSASKASIFGPTSFIMFSRIACSYGVRSGSNAAAELPSLLLSTVCSWHWWGIGRLGRCHIATLWADSSERASALCLYLGIYSLTHVYYCLAKLP